MYIIIPSGGCGVLLITIGIIPTEAKIFDATVDKSVTLAA